MNSHLTSYFIESFEWESEAQKKGVLNFLQWIQDRSTTSPGVARALAENSVLAWSFAVTAYVAQKEHDSSEWWAKAVGDQVRALEDQIRLLQSEVRGLRQALRPCENS